jgi:hypothetical protein
LEYLRRRRANLAAKMGSYPVISYFATAAVGAIAFYIAQKALRLGTGLSLLGAMLVVLSPPVLDNLWGGLANAREPLATVLVAGAFLAVVTRRDFLCLTLLFFALLMTETAVWAPLAAAMTVMLRPKQGEQIRQQALTALAMFLPVAMWLGLRVTFGEIGGTYAIEGYTPLADFLQLTFYKLRHIHKLFLTYHPLFANTVDDEPTPVDRIIYVSTALVLYALLCLWAFRTLSEAVDYLRCAIQEKRWPIGDQTFLVALWALIALAFHFALPLKPERYATSVVVFAWPALVAEVEKRRKTIIWLGLAVCCVMSLTRSSYAFVEHLNLSSSRKFSVVDNSTSLNFPDNATLLNVAKDLPVSLKGLAQEFSVSEHRAEEFQLILPRADGRRGLKLIHKPTLWNI